MASAATATARAFSFSSSSYFDRHPFYNLKQAAARRSSARRPPLALAIEWALFERAVPIAPQEALQVFPAAASSTSVAGGVNSFIYLREPLSRSSFFLVREPHEVRSLDRRKVAASDGNRLLIEEPNSYGVKLYVFTAHRELGSTLDELPPYTTRLVYQLGPGLGLLSYKCKPQKEEHRSKDDEEEEDGDQVEDNVDQYGVSCMTISNLEREAPVAFVDVYSSARGHWISKEVPTPVITGTPRGGWLFWTTEATLSYADSILWVDYRRGNVLICNVLSKKPVMLHMALPPSEPSEGRIQPWKRRSLTVADDKLKFIDICGEARQPDREIVIWSLDNAGYIWRQEARLRISNCPHAEPLYPLLNPFNANQLICTMIRAVDVGIDQTVAGTLQLLNWREAIRLGTATQVVFYWDTTRYTPYLSSEIGREIADPPEVVSDSPGAGEIVYPLMLLEAPEEVIKLKSD